MRAYKRGPADLRALINSGAKTYVQHGESFGTIQWSRAQGPVRLVFDNSGALSYEGFGGYAYGHYAGDGVWLRREGSEHALRVVIEKPANRKRAREEPEENVAEAAAESNQPNQTNQHGNDLISQVEREFLDKLWRRQGFPRNPLGQSFVDRHGKTCKVVGFAENHRDYSVVVEEGGRERLWSKQNVKRALQWDDSTQVTGPSAPVPPPPSDLDTSESTARRLGLPRNYVGQSFTHRGKTYTVRGYKTRNRKYPIICDVSDGKRRKCDTDMVRIALMNLSE